MLVITNHFFQKINGKIPELLYIRYQAHSGQRCSFTNKRSNIYKVLSVVCWTSDSNNAKYYWRPWQKNRHNLLAVQLRLGQDE